MARIRTVKPETFTHEELFDSEKATGLPLRLAYIGLWTACDREGRFLWRPRQLKTDILPYDDEIDFSRVLDALWTRGFLVKYASDGNVYGCIPSWSKHQFINNREKDSDLPEPTTETIISIEQSDTSTTREPRVTDACPTRLSPSPSSSLSPSSSNKVQLKEFEDTFWPRYPNKVGKAAAIPKFLIARRSASLQTIMEGLERYIRDKPPDRAWCNPATWLNQERWFDELATTGPPQSPVKLAYDRVRAKIEGMTNGNGRHELCPGSRPLLTGEPSEQAPRSGNSVGAIDDPVHREAEGFVAENGSSERGGSARN